MASQHRWSEGREWRGDEDEARREGSGGHPRGRLAPRQGREPASDDRVHAGGREGRRLAADYDPEAYTPNPREGRGPEPRSFRDRAADEVATWFGDEGAERRREWDHQLARYRGKGPKGYKRSDERIREDVNDRLTDDPYLDASDIEVVVEAAEVTLIGTVCRREDKRRAEDLVDSVSGVEHVQNNLRVARPGVKDAGEADIAGGGA